ncbi:MAG: esterase-like activity of phytase family protein [Pseudomonadota bacterium]
MFEIGLEGATDAVAMPRLDCHDLIPASKRLALDFDALRDADNGVDGVLSHEALVSVSTLGDGRPTLVMLSDNDGNRLSLLLVLAVTMN